jgi:hypothetical protein
MGFEESWLDSFPSTSMGNIISCATYELERHEVAAVYLRLRNSEHKESPLKNIGAEVHFHGYRMVGIYGYLADA